MNTDPDFTGSASARAAAMLRLIRLLDLLHFPTLGSGWGMGMRRLWLVPFLGDPHRGIALLRRVRRPVLYGVAGYSVAEALPPGTPSRF
eukprot:3183187-Pleurochrysis_carterae.AAC.2